MNFSGISRETLLGKALRLPLRAIPKDARLPILQGRLRGKRWIVGSGTHGCWLGSYEFRKRRLFERMVQPGAVVYDIGANAGLYTLLASVLAGPRGTVVAFEPLPRNLSYLYEHLRLNRVTNVRVIETAVADRNGMARFDPGASPSLGRLSSDGTLEVATLALDPAIASGELPPPDVMKIDVEGAEGSVLRGAVGVLAQHRPLIFLATHGPEVHDQCIGLLRSQGYRLTPIDGLDVESSEELLASAAR